MTRREYIDTEGDFDFDARYQHPDYPGIAWNVYSFYTEPDEDTEWSGYEVVDRDRVKAHMVGDDRTFVFDTDDMIKLSDEDYCPECGQIGCKGAFLG